MSRYRWSRRSRERLDTCHPLLIELFDRVIARDDLPHDLIVLCGHRSREEQEAAYRAGTSRLRWPRSRHNTSPSMAVDVAPYVGGAVSWDWRYYHEIAPIVKAEWAAMTAEGRTGTYSLTWGGDWSKFPDGPHWQIDGVRR